MTYLRISNYRCDSYFVISFTLDDNDALEVILENMIKQGTELSSVLSDADASVSKKTTFSTRKIKKRKYIDGDEDNLKVKKLLLIICLKKSNSNLL